MIRPLAVLVCWLPGAALACPACFGADEDARRLGTIYSASIGMLLAVTFGLLIAGALWFRALERRRQALLPDPSAGNAAPSAPRPA